MRTASCRHSTLAIDDRRVGPDYAVRALAPGRVRVALVEGVDRTAWGDLNAKARGGCQVTDGKLHPLDLGMPEEQNFGRPAKPLGKFSSWRTHAFALAGDGPSPLATARAGLVALSATGLDLPACR